MNFVISSILYVVIGILLAKGGINVVDNTAIYLGIALCVVAIDLFGYMRGASRDA